MARTKDTESPMEMNWVPGMLKKPKKLNWKCAKPGCHLTWDEHLGKKGQLLKRFKDHTPISTTSNRRSRRAAMRNSISRARKQAQAKHRTMHWLQEVRVKQFMEAISGKEK